MRQEKHGNQKDYVGFKKNESDGGKTDIELWH